KPTDFWSLKLPRETRNYIPRLLALTQVINQPEKYGIKLKPMPNKPYFTSVDIGFQLDFALAAQMAGISTDSLYRLNPGFNRWATAPEGPHKLNLPITKTKAFAKKLAKLDPSERIQWKRYQISAGDSLSTIAEKHGTTATMLKQVNKLGNSGIHTGTYLIIPTSTKSLDHYALNADEGKQDIQDQKHQGQRMVHVVKAGDTLWDLAKTYKVNHNKLARWNDMAVHDTLSLGQKLVLWIDSKSDPAKKTAQLPSIMDIKPPNTTNQVHYRVRNGDSLARIAQRFNVRVADLKRWNTIDSNYLKTGQNLKLVVDVTAQTL
ncbi:MAG: LysM peptidoglycan-binding domain-containing protein, partial [Gammaproteobacteria bacterium]|nr:LysM peptidoglycan-binding domain-containing protein [Gammaproteobacteria bacterium]